MRRMEGTKEGGRRGPQKLQELQKSRISRMGYYLVPPAAAAFVAMGSSSSAVSVLHGWDAAAAAAASVGNQIKPVFSPSMILADPDEDSSAAPNRVVAAIQ